MRLSYEFDNLLGAVYHRGTIKFGPDGCSIFSPVGNKVIVYDLKGGKSGALPLQVNYNINQICIHPKGSIMLAASEKSHLYMVSLLTGKLLHLKEYKTFPKINHISFSPDGRYYCVCGDNLVLIYVTPGTLLSGRNREITPFRLLKKMRINHDTITDVAWSSNSNFLCIACRDISLNIIWVEERERNICRLKGHSDSLIACYCAQLDSKDMIFSLTKNCQLFVWDRSETGEEIGDENMSIDDLDKEQENDPDRDRKRQKRSLMFTRSAKHYLKLAIEPDESKEEKKRRTTAYITASDYNSKVNLLAIGYNTGHYSLYEMPSATLIYDLDSKFGSISSINFNHIGDWIVFGSSVDPEVDTTEATNNTQSRLFVWEWQSKSNVIDQIGSGASMLNMHECVSYSLDGTHVVSGNISGRIKVWCGQTGETVATFGDEHIAPIKAIKFVPNKSGKVIISASLDGTLRAYDLNKFKNFRTFRSPAEDKTPEFTCLDVDSTGEFIAAGTYNYFEIYLYSLQTGKFLEYLTGHEGPVSSVTFSPNLNILISSSWDHTIRVWNLFEGSKCMRDTITFNHEIVTTAFRPDGNQFAASLSNGQIALFNAHSSEQIGAPIDGSGDLGTTQLISEASKDNKKFFMTLSYSADGTFIIGGGNSNYICIYHAEEKILVKKIAITFNMSMDGIFDYTSSRKRNELGYNLELLEQRLEERTLKPIQLPGVRKGDLGDRQAKPVIAMCQIVFSPTMRSFAAATTEGVLIYSIDKSRHFDPYRLAIDINPATIRAGIARQEFGTSLIRSLQLNDRDLVREVIEKMPLVEMDSIISSMDVDFAKRLSSVIAGIIPDTRHLEYYMLWVKKILYTHGITLKSLQSREITPIIRSLHQNVFRSYMDIKKNSNFCKYSLEYLTNAKHGEQELNNIDDSDSEVE